jgi:hypothetical protein
VIKVIQVPKVQLEHKVRQVLKVLKVPQVLKEQPVLQEPKAQ